MSRQLYSFVGSYDRSQVFGIQALDFCFELNNMSQS